jgi:hypothetical protein
MLKVEGKTNYMNNLDYSTRARLIASLRKTNDERTLEDAVLMVQHLTDSQMMTPKHTLFKLMIEQAHESGLHREIAQALVSVDQQSCADAWRCA